MNSKSSAALAVPAGLRMSVRALLLGWFWQAVLWGFSHYLTHLPAWGWLAAVLLLSALPGWGLWQAFMLRKKVLRFQFAVQGRVGRWLSGGWWPAIKSMVLALIFVSAALWQSWFLARWEWLLLAVAVPVYVLFAAWLQMRLTSEFSSPAFAWAWAQRAAKALLVLLLGGFWVYMMARHQDFGRALAPAMAPAALDAALAQIHAAPSGLVRWGLDGLLAIQVAGGALADLPQAPVWRLLVLALFGPLGLLLCMGAVMQAAMGGRAIWQQAAPVGSTRSSAPMIALMGVLVLGILVQTTASLDGLARNHESPLALQRLPECERIGQKLYHIGTLDETRKLALDALGQMQAGQAMCQGMSDMDQQLDVAVDRYLDWYFSLGAEWGRIFSLLTGDVSQFLQNKLSDTLLATPGLETWMHALQKQAQVSGNVLMQGQQRIEEVLARHHLALDASQCLLRADVPQLPALDLLGNASQRLTASAVAGTGAGAFAAVVAGKAMAKTSMKAASKVLAKAAAKQGLGKAGAAVAGAAVGSVVPGIGTAAGAIAGAVAGAIIGVGIDWAALYAEEMLTRDAMRADLQAALRAQTQAFKVALACQ